jgi:hypothetical protein
LKVVIEKDDLFGFLRVLLKLMKLIFEVVMLVWSSIGVLHTILVINRVMQPTSFQNVVQ